MPDIEHMLARAIYALTPWDAWLRPRRGARRVLRALSERGYVVVPAEQLRGSVARAEKAEARVEHLLGVLRAIRSSLPSDGTRILDRERGQSDHA